MYACPIVSRMAASTLGCRPNFPATRTAARSKAVRTFRSGSGLARPDRAAALACAKRSFCKKSLTASAVCSACRAVAASPVLTTTPATSTRSTTAVAATSALCRRANFCSW